MNTLAQQVIPEPSGPRALQPFLRRLRQWLYPGLEQQLQAERATVVQILNQVAHYLTERESDVTRSVAEIADDLSQFSAQLQETPITRAPNLHATPKEETSRAEIRKLETRLAELEALLLRSLPKGPTGEQPTTVTASEARYTLFENRFRGSQQEISARLKPYTSVFAQAKLPVLELGSGRGELLSLFQETGLQAYGVDNNQSMVDECKNKGLNANREDLFEHLAECKEKSLGGIIAVQVIEHLRVEQLESLIELASRALSPGSKLVFETINPLSLTSLISNFHRDPTHVQPVHPDTLAFLLESSAFRVIETKWLHPIPEAHKLQHVSIENWMNVRSVLRRQIPILRSSIRYFSVRRTTALSLKRG